MTYAGDQIKKNTPIALDAASSVFIIMGQPALAGITSTASVMISYQNEYLEPLFKIIKALEKSDSLVEKAETQKTKTLPVWSQFINETYGCLSEAKMLIAGLYLSTVKLFPKFSEVRSRPGSCIGQYRKAHQT